MRNNYCIILETTTVVSPDDIQILEETKLPSGHSKISFKTRLQESDKRNANNRSYNSSICESIVSQLHPKASSRNMLMEIDHPLFFPGSTDPNTMKKRASMVEINNCGALCRNIIFKNNEILGEVETLSAFKGPDLSNLVSKDKVNIGFSLRALGGVNKSSNGVMEVNTIYPINISRFM